MRLKRINMLEDEDFDEDFLCCLFDCSCLSASCSCSFDSRALRALVATSHTRRCSTAIASLSVTWPAMIVSRPAMIVSCAAMVASRAAMVASRAVERLRHSVWMSVSLLACGAALTSAGRACSGSCLLGGSRARILASVGWAAAPRS